MPGRREVCVWGRVACMGGGGEELVPPHVVLTMADLLFCNLDKPFEQSHSLDEVRLSAELCYHPVLYLENNHIT